MPEAERLDASVFLPAIGQGALALETRADAARELVERLDHRETHVAVEAERAFMRRASGSCLTPMAAYGVVDAEAVTLTAVILDPDGRRAVRGSRRGAPADAIELGEALAAELLDAGGADILREVGIAT